MKLIKHFFFFQFLMVSSVALTAYNESAELIQLSGPDGEFRITHDISSAEEAIREWKILLNSQCGNAGEYKFKVSKFDQTLVSIRYSIAIDKSRLSSTDVMSCRNLLYRIKSEELVARKNQNWAAPSLGLSDSNSNANDLAVIYGTQFKDYIQRMATPQATALHIEKCESMLSQRLKGNDFYCEGNNYCEENVAVSSASGVQVYRWNSETGIEGLFIPLSQTKYRYEGCAYSHHEKGSYKAVGLPIYLPKDNLVPFLTR